MLSRSRGVFWRPEALSAGWESGKNDNGENLRDTKKVKIRSVGHKHVKNAQIIVEERRPRALSPVAASALPIRLAGG